MRQYEYEDDYAPILPRGTILHHHRYMDNTPNNTNIPDPRNCGQWQPLDCEHVHRPRQIMPLTDAEFQARWLNAASGWDRIVRTSLSAARSVT